MAETLTRDDRKALALVDRHAKSRQSLALALLKALLGLWGGFDGWANRDLVTGHAARSAVLVDTFLARDRRLARSYATTMLRTVNAMPTKPMPPVEDIYPRSGSNQVEVYSRPAEQYLYARSIGKTDAEARQAVEQRLTDLALADIMLVERDETQRTFARAPKVIGHRRIIHPELSESGFSCGLCIVAADRVYSKPDLMPIHDHCNCTDAPITTGFDPGARLNRADLDEFYEEAGSTAAGDLVNVRVRVNEHGELGPVLTRADHAFRDAAKASTARKQFTEFERPDMAEQRAAWQKMINRSRGAIARLEGARAAGDASTEIVERGYRQKVSDYDTAIKYHNGLIALYSDRLAR